MRRRKPSVLILYNIPVDPRSRSKRCFAESDAGVLDEVREASEALTRLQIPFRATGVANFRDLPAVLASSPEKIILNLVEGFHSSPGDMNYVPAVCRAFGKSATGGDTSCLLAAFNKWQTKCVLLKEGVPTPPGVLVPMGEKIPRQRLPRGPYIVKPILSDASEGIDDESVVKTRGPELDRAVARVHTDLGQHALIEQMVGRRELNVTVIERNGGVEVMPLAEIDFGAFGDEKPRIVGYAAKWLTDTFEYQNTPIILPAPLPEAAAERVRRCARAAWRALGCRDYARVDIRIDDESEPYVLEVNPNPDITSASGFAAAVRAGGITFDEMIEILVLNAQTRLEKPVRVRRPSRGPRLEKGMTRIRPTTSADRGPIREFLIDTGFFRPDEIDVAMEVLDDAIAAGSKGDYQSYAAEVAGEVAGWVCFGPTPCTIGTYDIYWIAVNRRHQGKGLGTVLIKYAEEQIAKQGGRLAVIETSGREIYHPTRQFYIRRGYSESARLRDFYAPGDDKVVYTKPVAR